MTMASAAPASGSPAGFLLRLVAAIIDSVILTIIVFVISFVLGFALGMDGVLVATIVAYAAGGIIALFYWAKLESGKDQATPGKKVMKIKVVSASGGALDFAGAIKRSWVHWLGYFVAVVDIVVFGNYYLTGILGIAVLVSCIAVAVKSNKQGFHDDWAAAQVVRA
ncbi:MAG: RDD family protein [Reyranellaceae bacterium]